MLMVWGTNFRDEFYEYPRQLAFQVLGLAFSWAGFGLGPLIIRLPGWTNATATPRVAWRTSCAKGVEQNVDKLWDLGYGSRRTQDVVVPSIWADTATLFRRAEIPPQKSPKPLSGSGFLGRFFYGEFLDGFMTRD
jgi:hypothetical protein